MIVSRHSYSLPLFVDEMVSDSRSVGSTGAPLLLAAGRVIMLLNEGRCTGHDVGAEALLCVGDAMLDRQVTAAAVDGAAAGA